MLTKEEYLNTILIESFLKGLYFRQFSKPRQDMFDMFSFGSKSTNLTNSGKQTKSKMTKRN